jgi:hypothetical protein
MVKILLLGTMMYWTGHRGFESGISETMDTMAQCEIAAIEYLDHYKATVGHEPDRGEIRCTAIRPDGSREVHIIYSKK